MNQQKKDIARYRMDNLKGLELIVVRDSQLPCFLVELALQWQGG